MSEKFLFNQVKRDQWREDDYSMPIIARFGTGGGNMPIVVETFNQISQSAVYKEDDIAVSLTVCGGSYGGAAKSSSLKKGTI